jgi:hypothetical protein
MTDTLKSICEQCARLNNPQLEFIPTESQRQKEIILRDLKELVSAALGEQEKSVVVLAGGLFEAVLYSFIQAQSSYIAARRGSFAFDPEQSLDNFVSIFNRWFSDVFTIPDIVVSYRDVVHINRELQHAVDVCPRASREMLRILDTLLGKLAEITGI